MSIDFNKKYKLVFTKQDTCGFKQGHIYEVSFNQDSQTKTLTGIASYDYTIDAPVTLHYPLASSLSIDRYFVDYEEKSWI